MRSVITDQELIDGFVFAAPLDYAHGRDLATANPQYIGSPEVSSRVIRSVYVDISLDKYGVTGEM